MTLKVWVFTFLNWSLLHIWYENLQIIVHFIFRYQYWYWSWILHLYNVTSFMICDISMQIPSFPFFSLPLFSQLRRSDQIKAVTFVCLMIIKHPLFLILSWILTAEYWCTWFDVIWSLDLHSLICPKHIWIFDNFLVSHLSLSYMIVSYGISIWIQVLSQPSRFTSI